MTGKSCAPAIEQATREVCAAAAGYSHVVNGRFKGGWTTRHYGRPGDGVHAIQMELTQATHLESEALPFAYSHREGRAGCACISAPSSPDWNASPPNWRRRTT